jgi:hypothetical protein
MAEKKHYLIRVWDISGLKESDKSKESFVVKEENSHDGFNLVQEKIIKSYENNIKNLHVPKGLRSTYEEVKAPREDSKKAHA